MKASTVKSILTCYDKNEEGFKIVTYQDKYCSKIKRSSNSIIKLCINDFESDYLSLIETFITKKTKYYRTIYVKYDEIISIEISTRYAR